MDTCANAQCKVSSSGLDRRTWPVAPVRVLRLLEVEFRRLSGRTGPGAGRPSKLYRRSSRQLSVSLPERRYDLVGGVLASAIDRSISEGEPRTSEREICLANCPFDRLATEHTELVCGLNLALVDGVIDGLGVSAVSAVLAPQPGFCRVKVSRRDAP